MQQTDTQNMSTCSLSTVCPPQVQPRPSTVAKEVVVVIGGVPQDGTYLTQTVEMYDPQRGKWLPLPDFPQLVSWFSATVLHNSIYVTGGILNSHIVANTWRFDAVKRVWQEAQPMLKPRAHHSSAVLGDRLYVVGGLRFELNKMLNIETIECYNSSTNTWTAAGRTMFPRKQAQLVVYDATIVEVGGLQLGESEVDTMMSYHIVDDMIKPTGEQFVLPRAIRYAQAVVINSVFYILWEDTKEFIALDAKKRLFHRLPSPKYSRRHSGTEVVQGKIYVVGGLIDSKPSRLVECFDPDTNTWTVDKDLKEGRGMHGCVKLKMSWWVFEVIFLFSGSRCCGAYLSGMDIHLGAFIFRVGFKWSLKMVKLLFWQEGGDLNSILLWIWFCRCAKAISSHYYPLDMKYKTKKKNDDIFSHFSR